MPVAITAKNGIEAVHRRDFNRLALTGLTAGAVFAPSRLMAHPSLDANINDLEWICRVVKFDPEPMHDSPPVITEVAVQAEGEFVAVVGDDHIVRLCRKDTGEIIKKLRGHADWVRTAQFSPNGATLVSAGNDRSVLEWNPATYELIRRIGLQANAIVSVAFNPAGTELATVGFDDRLVVYKLTDAAIRMEMKCPCDDMRTVAYSHDGAMVVAGGRSGVLRVWDANTGSEMRDIAVHRRRIHRAFFLPDNRTVVSCAEDRLVKLSDVLTADEPIALPRRPCKVQTVAQVGPDLIASGGSDNLIRLWNRNSLEEIGQLVGHRGTVTSIAFDGIALYSGSYDTEMRIWTVSDEVARRLQAVPHIGQRNSGLIIE